MKYPNLILIGLFLLLSCEENPTSLFIHIDSASGIDLRNIQPGDQSKYILYSSRCSENFQFTGDTLVVEVFEKNDSLFLREQYTAGSPRQRTVEHAIFPRDGYVLIPQRFGSKFLFFYGNDTIFLDQPATVQLVQSGCQLLENSDPFIGNAIGSVDQFEFGNIQINDRKSISCVPGGFTLDAYIFYGDHLNAIHIIRDDIGENNITGFVAIE